MALSSFCMGWKQSRSRPRQSTKNMGALRQTQKVRISAGENPLLPPVAGTDGIEVLQDVLQKELQELCQLPRHAEHVRALLEGAGQDLVSGKELVADLPQRSQGLA